MTERFDAIVVGGGLAGVIAARELAHRGLSTVVLEARERLGGRAWTDQWQGAPIEMGGQNVHWAEPFIWSEITRYGLPIAEVPPFESWGLAESDGLRLFPPAEAGAQLGRAFEAFFGSFGGAFPRPYDPTYDADALSQIDSWSIADRLASLDLPEEEARWLRPWLAMRTGGSLEEGAFTWIAHIFALAEQRWPRMLEVSGRFRLVGGIKTLIDRVIADSGAVVRLGQPVVTVADDGRSVEVTTAGGERYVASTVVMATSGNLWSRISFPGGLSDVKLDASRTGLQTPVSFTKIWALVQGPVPNVYVQRPAVGEHPIVHLRKDLPREDGTTQVIAFSNDPGLAKADDSAIARAFTETLPLPGAEIVAVRAHDWVSDPHTLGGTSLLRPGHLRNLDALRAPEGRIAFATADISSTMPGYDGAVQTGIKAAADAVAVAGSDVSRRFSPA
ncbi:flavin monoamine oxidase family protein [Streptomyces sp. NPDC005374]|uniref:flavin monoamine oxidase family protein n=1 Tax=Streptomyces sp. NPDC005374 TaxID=3364713 RepID=UPI00368D1A10